MYQLQKDTILHLSDNATIPMDEGNTDYQEYLKWLEEGNEPLPILPDSSLFLINGQARKDRIQKQSMTKTKSQFNLMQQQIAKLQTNVNQLQ